MPMARLMDGFFSDDADDVSIAATDLPIYPARKASPPDWRSILFVPATGERFLEKAHLRGADAIQIDLEDSVAADLKDEARRRLPGIVARLHGLGVELIVRINRPWRQALADLDAAVREGVSVVTLPKVEEVGQVRVAAEIIEELENERGLPMGGIGLLLLIESPAALPRLAELCAASPRVVAMTLGPEDYALAAGCTTDAESLFLPNLLVAQAGAAAGVLPLGFVGSIGDYGDVEDFRARIRQARRLGFRGAAVIHPAQVPILNEEFAPSAEERGWAERVLAAASTAQSLGRGAFEVDRKMVDRPIVERARRLLVRRAAP
jgi:citrate lyase subunit beta / citryl-CoA lyase